MASGLFINCSRQAPCPICGGTDWCSWLPKDDGSGLILSCKRAARDNYDMGDVFGHDGNIYEFRSYKNGQYFYEEKMQSDRSREDYRNSHNNHYREYRFVDKVEPESDQVLNIVYRTLLNNLVLEERHYRYLKNEGWTDEMILQSNIKSFPESDYARYMNYIPYKSHNMTRKELAACVMKELNVTTLRGVPGAYIKSSNKDNSFWTFHGHSGLVLPIYNIDGQIIRLRTRLDYLGIEKNILVDNKPAIMRDGQVIFLGMSGPYIVVDGKKQEYDLDEDSYKGKMRPFQSYFVDREKYAEGIIENTFLSGCESKNQLSFYIKENDNMEICLIIEGEKKGQYTNFMMNVPVIALPGVNSYEMLFRLDSNGKCALDYMVERGVKIFAVAYDADKSINPTVLKYEKLLLNALVEHNYLAASTDWHISCGKGTDDMLKNGFFPNFSLYG